MLIDFHDAIVAGVEHHGSDLQVLLRNVTSFASHAEDADEYVGEYLLVLGGCSREGTLGIGEWLDYGRIRFADGTTTEEWGDVTDKAVPAVGVGLFVMHRGTEERFECQCVTLRPVSVPRRVTSTPAVFPKTR
ncbi:MAG: hypothetical protein M3Y87_18695 [Myxococcota bacterium]|nr:hypothetical protein [Myxococcota bacterium]